MPLDNYNPATSLSAYYPSRDERRPARLWATEKLLHDMAELGMVEFFEGPGTDPTVLDGYASNKLWLQVSSGVTAQPGIIRAFDGEGDPSVIGSWPELDQAGFARFIGAVPGEESSQPLEVLDRSADTVQVHDVSSNSYRTAKVSRIISHRSLADWDIHPGSDADLTDAINAAIAEISSGVLVIPPGDYRCDGKIIISDKNGANNAAQSNLEILAFGARFINDEAEAGDIVLEFDDCKYLRVHGLEFKAAAGCKVLFDGFWTGELSHVKTGNLIWSFGEENYDTFESHYWSRFIRCDFLALELHTGVTGDDRTEFNSDLFDTCRIGPRPEMSETGAAYAISIYGTHGPQSITFLNCDLSYYTTGLIYVADTLTNASHMTFIGGYLDTGLVGLDPDAKNLSVNFYHVHAPNSPSLNAARLTPASKQSLDFFAGAHNGSRYPTSAFNLVKNGDLRDGVADITLSSGGAGITATPTVGDYGLFGQHVNIATAANRTATFATIPVPFDGHYAWTVVIRNNGDALRCVYTVNGSDTTFDAMPIPSDSEWAVMSFTNLNAVAAGDVLGLRIFATSTTNLDYDIAYVGCTYGRIGQLFAPLHPMAGSLQLRDSAGDNRLSVKLGNDLSADRTATLSFPDADTAISLGDWFDQSVKTTASPTFATEVLTHQASIPTAPSAGYQKILTFDSGHAFRMNSAGRLFPTTNPAARVQKLDAINNSTSVTNEGIVAGADEATGTAIAAANTSYFTRQHRMQSISAAATGEDCGRRIGSLWLAEAGLVSVRFGFEDFQANAAAFAGLKPGGAHPDSDPSGFTSCIGVGIDAGQTTWRLLHNDGSGSATAVDLGSDFPANTDATDFYELMLWWPAGGAKVYYQFVRENTGHVASGVISSNLPPSSTTISLHAIANTRTGSSALSLSWSKFYIETA